MLPPLQPAWAWSQGWDRGMLPPLQPAWAWSQDWDREVPPPLQLVWAWSQDWEREAYIPPCSGADKKAPAAVRAENSWKRNQQAGEPSIREKICNHEQDGNELQTTPEFRAHVAKKLDTILDNAITLSTCPLRLLRHENSSSLEEDNGFRLFSSSVPGDCGEPEAAPRKQSALQHSNSSIACDSSSGLESDPEWQRCLEVAVTAADILKQSGLPPPAAQDSSQTIEAGWKKVKKKKKKKKGKREESGQPDAIEAAGNSQDKEPSYPSSPEAIRWTETMQRKRKRKRRETKGGTE
ncbi:protein CUSTOS [Ahaetulla prasina]|uniref:protein CUSTOS n=1 Tax=Ahaetulla prasina TaxID=499056 RepID=UPI0026478A21|nr:protein CUSTOS [Ahaetulla prasina]